MRSTPSIRRWLVGWLLGGVILVCAVAGYAIFHTARSEAAELFDYELQVIAESLPRVQLDASAPHSPQMAGGVLRDDQVTIQTWVRGTKGFFDEHADIPDLPIPRQGPGFKTIEIDEKHWRVFGVDEPDRYIQVAQPIEVRDQLALQLAVRTLWPLGILLPGAMVVVLIVVSYGLRPLTSLSAQIKTRSAEALDPIEADSKVPVELRPLVVGLNDLLRRLDTALEQQRRFVADAAHELRSPLAALKLQLQVGLRDGTLSGDAETIGRLEDRLNRAIHLISQLLALAREDAISTTKMAPFDLQALAARVLADASIAAETKSLDLGLEPERTEGDVRQEHARTWWINGDEHALHLLIGNLVDNAVRYTQPNGKIDLAIGRDRDGIWLEVTDDGPGIPDDETARVFDRFFRGSQVSTQGSGLGLAIAMQVAVRHHATLTLRNRTDGKGLVARLAGLTPVQEVSVNQV